MRYQPLVSQWFHSQPFHSQLFHSQPFNSQLSPGSWDFFLFKIKDLKIAINSKNRFPSKKFISGIFRLILDKFCPKVLKVVELSFTFYAMRKKQNAQTRHSSRKKSFYVSIFFYVNCYFFSMRPNEVFVNYSFPFFELMLRWVAAFFGLKCSILLELTEFENLLINTRNSFPKKLFQST